MFEVNFLTGTAVVALLACGYVVQYYGHFLPDRWYFVPFVVPAIAGLVTALRGISKCGLQGDELFGIWNALVSLFAIPLLVVVGYNIPVLVGTAIFTSVVGLLLKSL